MIDFYHFEDIWHYNFQSAMYDVKDIIFCTFLI
jgi:hypothetical protein